MILKILYSGKKYMLQYSSRNLLSYIIYNNLKRDFYTNVIYCLPRTSSTPNHNKFSKTELKTLYPYRDYTAEDTNDALGIESDENAIFFDKEDNTDLEKFQDLIRSKTKHEEIVSVAPFGQIRIDSDNLPNKMPRGIRLSKRTSKRETKNIEQSNQASDCDKITTLDENKLSPVNSVIFNSKKKCDNEQESATSEKNIEQSANCPNDSAVNSSSYVDECYFENAYSENLYSNTNEINEAENIIPQTYLSEVNNNITLDENDPHQAESIKNSNDLSYIDRFYFESENINMNETIASATKLYDNFDTQSPKENIDFIKNINSQNDIVSDPKLTDSCNNKNHSSETSESYIDQYYFENTYEITDTEDKNSTMNSNLSVPLSNENVKDYCLNNEHSKLNENIHSANDLNDNPNKYLPHFDKISSSSQHHKSFDMKGKNVTLNQEQEIRVVKKVKSDLDDLHTNNKTIKRDLDTKNNNIALGKIFNKFSFNVKKTDTLSTKSENYKDTVFDEYMKTENVEETNQEKLKAENEECKTALDYAVKLKKATQIRTAIINDGDLTKITGEKLDSKGFRILKYQTPDLSKLTREELLNILTKRVIYINDDIVVLDKPYNLVIHDAKTTKEPCLSPLLDDLARELDKKSSKPKLITVHRLDKETTGCLLLARNEMTAEHVKSLFAQRKITKTYWIVTSHVPKPMEGTIDIPITEGKINGKVRMVLSPLIPDDLPYKVHVKHGKRAITHYKVIATSGNAAFVEVQPETGLKHQIRVHFGFGLGCPIIGDHKYSHLDKLAPQKLPSDLLQKLYVRQSKVRYIPMHIHARSIIVPNLMDGRDVFAVAPMPDHMSKNMKRLKFRKK